MFTSAIQLKDYIKNKSKQTGANTNILLQNYMMERFLERLSLSDYRENMILKGGFLIEAMVGIGKRSTMDMDTTVKGLPMNRLELEKVLREIIVLDVGDGVYFELNDIKNIRDISEYNDYRVSMRATLFTIRVDMKIDFTTGDVIIPSEIEYPYKLMFEDRTIPVITYNLNTVLAEKIETIISRGVGNTRGRDYYDIYILIAMEKDKLSRSDLLYALRVKADERGSLSAMDDHSKIIKDIAASPDIANIWDNYKKRYAYAKDIKLTDILTLLSWVFVNE